MKNIFYDILIKIIYKIILILNKKYDSDLSGYKKFTHIINHEFSSYPYEGIRLFRTKPLEVWAIKTKSNWLFCSGDHILYMNDLQTIKVKDCVENITFLKTYNGCEKVEKVVNLGIKLHMYDVEINHYTHMYYSNGLLSHNTTCACAFLLWKAIFNEDQTILIAANKMSSALEIMSRIRYIYEELPQYMKPGVKVYNKSSIEFDNNSRIISRATTPDSGRGLSVSLLYCLDPDTKVTVRNKYTNDIYKISLKELYDLMD